MNKIKSTIKILFLSLTLGLTIVSCEDSLDIIQSNELNDSDTFNNVADLNNYLLGAVYASVNTTNEIKFTSVFTDEVGIAPTNTGQDVVLHRFFIDNSEAYSSGIWQAHYTTINRVNRLLKAAEGITPAAGEVVTYNSVLAQARALRAFAYIQLESYFTTNMADDNALGVVLSIEASDDLYLKLPRVNNGAVYNQINADLDFAYANLNTAASDYYFVTKPLIDALRARVNLNRGKHDLAKQYAQAAITGSGLVLTPATPMPAGTPALTGAWATAFYNESTPVATAVPYRNLWNDRSNTGTAAVPSFQNFRGENIWALSRPLTGAWGNIAALYTTNASNTNGSPLFDMGRNQYNLLLSYTNDIRKFAFVDTTSRVDAAYATNPNYITSDVIIIDKYPGKGNQNLRNDIKTVRLSEMYLILAECEAFGGNFTGAANYIKNIRDARRFTGTVTAPTYSSIPGALQDILKERRAELCFEGHRYVDLRRLGKTAGVSIDRHFTDDRISSLPTTLDINSYKFTLPIPLAEVQGNPTIVQNPGY
ncbi:RagB/SusD family nutrient uptake outer membrane protein [Chryseobacterium nematophagum]|uniref:RagB/SusD family nutrient uptake outer membrane protein n=1 Tax=Chryseobacterium nematophagum TaxID=2305228 RepID=A0A3M7LG37_9FLAO|nr:RagB/SusD family nutrient uptake outer membrane protein [Chryseobacterium nematophagum]RMZ61065.1 RagB/SusD family nutrient uptake outer membrane protein [Chryseobacterium nematophagum]